MGRKTFCTLGKEFLKFSEDELKQITHHKSSENFVKYLDSGYVNVQQETLVSRVFQRYEQGEYHPPVSGNVRLCLAHLGSKIDQISKLVCVLAGPKLLLQLTNVE